VSLLHPEQLRHRAERLFADVGALGTAAGLGFVSAERGVANQGIKALADGPWAFLDLRNVEGAKAEGLLTDVLAAGPRQLLIAAHREPAPALARVLKAYVDRAPELLLGGRKLARPEGAAVLLVLDGATNLVGLPEPYPSLSYWDFLP
jgi:hypothetical protein